MSSMLLPFPLKDGERILPPLRICHVILGCRRAQTQEQVAPRQERRQKVAGRHSPTICFSEQDRLNENVDFKYRGFDFLR